VTSLGIDAERQMGVSDGARSAARVGEATWKCLPVAAMVHPGKDNGRLLHDQTILYGCDPFDAPCDLPYFIDGPLRSNEAAQLDGALVRFDTDLE
jgi:hypothetical protein